MNDIYNIVYKELKISEFKLWTLFSLNVLVVVVVFNIHCFSLVCAFLSLFLCVYNLLPSHKTQKVKTFYGSTNLYKVDDLARLSPSDILYYAIAMGLIEKDSKESALHLNLAQQIQNTATNIIDKLNAFKWALSLLFVGLCWEFLVKGLGE